MSIIDLKIKRKQERLIGEMITSSVEVGSITYLREWLSHIFYNSTDKEIKYITFYYVKYNRVNDVVANTQYRATGPFESGCWKRLYFLTHYTNTAGFVLSKVHIEFMDGTKEVINGKDVVSTDDHHSKFHIYKRIPEEVMFKSISWRILGITGELRRMNAGDLSLDEVCGDANSHSCLR